MELAQKSKVSEMRSQNKRKRGARATLISIAALIAILCTITQCQESGSHGTLVIESNEKFSQTSQDRANDKIALAKQRWLAGTSEKNVRPHVKTVTNGGKVTVTFDQSIEFSSDFVDTLNASPNKYMALQVVGQNELRAMLPSKIPTYPVPAEDALLNLDQTTGEPLPIEQQNEDALALRKELHLVNWEALTVTSNYMTLRVLFDHPEEISSHEGATDTLYLTFYLEEFKTAEGAQIPAKSHISRLLPAQMTLEQAEIYETVGPIISWVMLGLFFMNGSLNTLFIELDYSALMDAVEGPQLMSFLAAFDVKIPASLDSLMAMIKDAASIEPQKLLNGDNAPTIAENVFGEQPFSEPLNERLATIGYEDMTPLDELGTVSVTFAMFTFGIIIMLMSYCCHSATGHMCCRRTGANLQGYLLWGSIINLILVFYLPVLTATFISTVGLQWHSTQGSGVLLNNVWTIFMLNAWLICPLILFIMFFRNRKEVGTTRHDAHVKRDQSKIQWKQDWLKMEQLAYERKMKNPELNSAKIQVQHHQNEAFEGGQREDERRSLINDQSMGFSVNGEFIDLENQGPPPRKNAWKIKGKQLPAWLVPRKRNPNQASRAQETPYLPTNIGIDEGDFTKEDQWAGHLDRDFGEFYKKMNLNERKVAKEAVLFYSMWSLWRKLVFAITIVFFDDCFRLQVFLQMVCAAVMILYIVGYWPCARYIDNISKIINELSFSAMLVCCVYLKEMRTGVNDFSPSGSPQAQAQGVSIVMQSILGLNLLFHAARLLHNSAQALKTLKLRRQQIASKWLGPPTHNDPDYSNDESSDDGDDEIMGALVNPDETPDLALLVPPDGIKVHEGLPQPDEMPAQEWDAWKAKVEPNLIKLRDELWFKMPPVTIDRITSKPGIIFTPPPTPPIREAIHSMHIPSEPSVVSEAVPDLELEIPRLHGKCRDLPIIPTLGEDAFPTDLKEALPERPGAGNELNMVVPQPPETVPVEPVIGQDCVVVQNKESIEIEYEIEFPQRVKKDIKPIIPGGFCDLVVPTLPEHIEEPSLFEIQENSIPPKPIEKKKMPGPPKSVWDEKRFRLGKPPKPLQPKPFQKVLNTIPMPMRIKNVPFKPIVTKEKARGKQQQKQPSQSPTRNQQTAATSQRPYAEPLNLPQKIEPSVRDSISKMENEWMPVRKPEKNQIALQQLTIADNQRFERVILGDIDFQTINLLNALKVEGKIQAYQLIGSDADPQAEVILNGGLVDMAKFTRMKKKLNEDHALSKMTNQLLHEQYQRSIYQTMASAQRLNSASPDTRSQKPVKQNYVGKHLLAPSASGMTGSEYYGEKEFKTFQEQHSPIHRAAQEQALSKASNLSPRVDLNELVRASHSRLAEEHEHSHSPSPSRSFHGSPMSSRPQTDAEKRFSSMQKPVSEISRGITRREVSRGISDL